MPCELKLLMWLPAIPVQTLLILQLAISSASARAAWIAVTVASMFTTTPRRRPFEAALPKPMISS